VGDGVSFGFTRPDCAKELPAKPAKNTKKRKMERKGIGRLFDYETQ
jgi:hypothetical protein